MTASNPVVTRYIESFQAALGNVAEDERREMVREIEDHVADATAAGKPLDQVLSTLGPAEALARAYAVELALNPSTPRMRTSDRALLLVGLVAAASVPSFVVCTVLVAVGAAFAASGLAVFVAGVAALIRPDLVPNITVAPWVCLLAGPLLAAAGVAALYALYLYVRFMIRLTKQTLARVAVSRGR